MRKKGRGPGLAKTRGLPLLRRRTLELWQCSDYRWRELFEGADVMSEGAVRHEAGGPVYYGSTSVLLWSASRGAGVDDVTASELARILETDPHARLRAVRVACLEAELRAPGPIGRVRAELFVRADARGVRVDVDVEARVRVESGEWRGRVADRETPSR